MVMMRLSKNISLIEQEVDPGFSGTIPNVEEFTKKILENIFDVVINISGKLSSNEKRFLKKNYLELYKDCLKNKEKGLPDLICLKEGEILFVEVKNKNDELRLDQIKWMKKNCKYKTLILEWDNNDSIGEEITNTITYYKEKLREERKEHKKKLVEKDNKISALEDKIDELREYIRDSPKCGI